MLHLWSLIWVEAISLTNGVSRVKAGRLENAIGWYHSHPGYGCWLSGIDVGTQMLNQNYQDPWLAVVVGSPSAAPLILQLLTMTMSSPIYRLTPPAPSPLERSSWVRSERILRTTRLPMSLPLSIRPYPFQRSASTSCEHQQLLTEVFCSTTD